ncbi:MAG: hypothetical protein RBT76_13515 [candidate division Zixibacteria bacterium]|jgi:F0F1-type ATP synthase membrane subunit c/vacuolar-type H+-ATPase subunit K|nr:hypothetical protein [candidate division Zixibacteria bacterium]
MNDSTPAPVDSPVLKIIVFAMLIGAPLLYLAVAAVITVTAETDTGRNVFLYMLLAVALLTPATIPLIERFQIAGWKNRASAQSPRQFLFSLVLVRCAMIEAVYIYGLVAFLLTAAITNMLFFYAIAIGWTFPFWPTESRLHSLLERMEKP